VRVFAAQIVKEPAPAGATSPARRVSRSGTRAAGRRSSRRARGDCSIRMVRGSVTRFSRDERPGWRGARSHFILGFIPAFFRAEMATKDQVVTACCVLGSRATCSSPSTAPQRGRDRRHQRARARRPLAVQAHEPADRSTARSVGPPLKTIGQHRGHHYCEARGLRRHVGCLRPASHPVGSLGRGLAAFVERELRAHTGGGMLARGFARVRCPDCGFEGLVAFSCKASICPSCATRRMEDGADHLVRSVSRPSRCGSESSRSRAGCASSLHGIRPLPRACSTSSLRAVFAWQRKAARRLGATDPRTGGVTAVQRAGAGKSSCRRTACDRRPDRVGPPAAGRRGASAEGSRQGGLRRGERG
jgi:ribosomal protein S27E